MDRADVLSVFLKNPSYRVSPCLSWRTLFISPVWLTAPPPPPSERVAMGTSCAHRCRAADPSPPPELQFRAWNCSKPNPHAGAHVCVHLLSACENKPGCGPKTCSNLTSCLLNQISAQLNAWVCSASPIVLTTCRGHGRMSNE